MRYRIPESSGGSHQFAIGSTDDQPGSQADGQKVLEYKQAKRRREANFAKWKKKMVPNMVRIRSDALYDYMKSFPGKDRANT